MWIDITTPDKDRCPLDVTVTAVRVDRLTDEPTTQRNESTVSAWIPSDVRTGETGPL
jgi:hypothetical protein